MLRIALRASNGQYLGVEADGTTEGGAAELRADRDGIGPWEVFTVIRQAGDGGVLTSGDRVGIRSAQGKYVVAEGGGGGQVLVNRSRRDEWETFVIEKAAGSGEIGHGDSVAFIASSGQYLTAEEGGGREVVANRSRASAGAWERFTLEWWNSTLVYLSASRGDYLVAERGGGREVRADRPMAGPWETFSLVNRSGREQGFESGDRVSLQVWNGRFLAAQGGGGGEVRADASRVRTSETFVIEKVDGSGGIGHDDSVALAASTGHYIVAEEGGGREVRASRDRDAPGAWGTFRVQFAAQQPVPFDRTPSSRVPREHPLSVRPRTANITLPMMALLVEYSDMPNLIDSTITQDHVRDIMFGRGRSVKSWLELNSYGRYTVRDAGVHGPIKIQLPFSDYGRAPLLANRERVESWERFTLERVAGPGSLRSGDQVYLRTHNDKYVTAQNRGGGYVFADTSRPGADEIFLVEKVEGAGRIEHEDVVALRTLIGFYLVAESGGSDLIKADRGSPGPWERFRLGREGGGGEIQSGDKVSFQVYNGLYVTPDSGALWHDVFNAAEREGISLAPLDSNADGVIAGNELFVVAFDFSGFSGVGLGHPYSVGGKTIRGVRYKVWVIGMGLFLQGGSVQGPDQLHNVFATLLHEICHPVFGLDDRYHDRRPLRGDLVGSGGRRLEREQFTLERLNGSGGQLRSGSSIALKAYNGKYVVAEGGGGGLVNADRQQARQWETFVIEKIDGGETIGNGDRVALQTAAKRKYLVAENEVIKADRDEPSTWETFQIEKIVDPAAPLEERVAFKTHEGKYVRADDNGRTTNPEHLEQGFVWGGTAGNGVGGGFDIMDDNGRIVMMAAYDRMNLGWLAPRVLTPENRSCYLLRPSGEHAELLVLFDPETPDEWYLVENREWDPLLDAVPSSGIVISWVNANREYWSRWLDSHVDGRYPVVISAVASHLPPNQMLSAPRFDNREYFGRQHPDAAFRSGDVVLPRGDGSPSRFWLSFHNRGSGTVAVCVL